jgi:hypothetical protein
MAGIESPWIHHRGAITVKTIELGLDDGYGTKPCLKSGWGPFRFARKGIEMLYWRRDDETRQWPVMTEDFQTPEDHEL